MNIHCPLDGRDQPEAVASEPSAARSFRCSDLEQFSKLFDGLELEGIQLSPGKFDGSLVVTSMEEASIHISRCVHAMEMRMRVGPKRFLFCVCLEDDSKELVFGARDPGSWIFLLPPEGCAAMPAPQDCTLVTMSISSEAILESPFLGPETRNWFSAIRQEGTFLRSKHLASRVKEDVTLALLGAESGSAITPPKSDRSVCQAMLSGIMSAFSLEWLVHGGFEIDRRATATDRYFRARHLICEHDFTIGEGLNDALSGLGSARSVEQAFSSHVKMGPHSYARAIRLHNTRQRLRDKRYADESVGNIAAQEGFWDCSRFALYYRKHFGEQPSQTRKKAMVRQRSPDFASAFKRFRH
ncbi:helix-turn-helix domain-containing protein [Roseibium sp. MMSF_3412]|uniref:helix-turn-helix domain-containing protein n=1 Tax=Roseibium sp. MMSF_3412 TaxID=3046712 RepID=UPI00273F4A41|nr:helix-turn-helix domain-containing protein [Roseibium sp. MMSF_3412]